MQFERPIMTVVYGYTFSLIQLHILWENETHAWFVVYTTRTLIYECSCSVRSAFVRRIVMVILVQTM